MTQTVADSVLAPCRSPLLLPAARGVAIAERHVHVRPTWSCRFP